MSEPNPSRPPDQIRSGVPAIGVTVADWRFRLAATVLGVLLVGHFALAYMTFRELSAANRWSLHSYAVLTESVALSEGLAHMESGFRGYALTGRSGFRDDWQAGRREFGNHLDATRRLTVDNPGIHTRLEELSELHRAWSTSQVDAGIEAEPTPDALLSLRNNAADSASADRRAALSRSMQDLLARIVAAESQLLTERAGRTERLERRTTHLLIAIALVAAALAGLLLWMILSRTRRLESTNAVLLRAMAERAASVAAIRRLNQRQELILHSAGEGIVGINAEGQTVFANTAATKMLGLTGVEVLGQPFDTLLLGPADARAAEAGDIVRAAIGSALIDGRAHDLRDAVFARRDGSTFPVEVIVTAAVDEGEVVGAVVTFQDVTKRREIDRMKDEFVSVVSHELRTPLTSIRGSLGLLASGQLGDVSERGQRMLNIAVQNTDRLVRLINDILDVERMASGKAVMHRAELDVARVVDDAVESVRGSAEKAGVALVVDAAPLTVVADADRLVQTLTNLLSNAIKFSPPDAEVKVHARRDGADVHFTVEDRGRGIPAEQLERIFERFHQVDSSDARRMGGTGLGLAICRSIVEHHDGRIWAESEPGVGSRFHFTIPKPAAVERAGPVVLVCDDDPTSRAMLAAILTRQGFAVVTAASGEEALSIAARATPAVIVLDLLLPGISGYETLTRLRQDPATRELPVVIVSVLEHAPAGTPERTEWVVKPVEPEALSDALDRALSRERPGRVLVIEDDEDLARVLLAMFHSRGITATHAATARDALDRIRRGPDVVVLDLVLPDGDGHDVVDWLRAHDRQGGTPLLVYTAAEVDADARRRLQLGRTEFVTKSRVPPEALERRVAELLGHAVMEEAVGAAAHVE